MDAIESYVSDGLNLLVSQYRNKERIAALFTALLTGKQDIEDAIQQVIGGTALATTVGVGLDNIGATVGISRNGLGDDAYRLLLYGKIAENNGDATLQTVMQLVLQLFNTDTAFQKSANSVPRNGALTGGFVVLMAGSPQVPESLHPLITRLLQQSLAAGVQLAHLGVFNKTKAFAFAGDRPWVGGFGSVYDSSAGAPFATLLTSAKD